MISILNAAEYYKGLAHQDVALEMLQKRISKYVPSLLRPDHPWVLAYRDGKTDDKPIRLDNAVRYYIRTEGQIRGLNMLQAILENNFPLVVSDNAPWVKEYRRPAHPNYEFIFEMNLRNTRSRIEGWLRLYNHGQLEHSWVATSGQPGYQHPGAYNTRMLGIAPPAKGMRVNLNPYHLPNVRGVEGDFYAMVPYYVPGYRRGDLGLHFDASVWGSSGCIVLRRYAEWVHFCSIVDNIYKDGIKEIPIACDYRY